MTSIDKIGIPRRRLLLKRLVQGLFGLGTLAAMVPFVRVLLPSRSQVLEVSIEKLAVDETIYVEWLGRRVLVRRNAVVPIATDARFPLKDSESQQSIQPDNVVKAHRAIREDVFVAYAHCTHLGCEVRPDSEGFFCPRHQSRFDRAGRVLKDAIAPANLSVPHYRFVSHKTLQLYRPS